MGSGPYPNELRGGGDLFSPSPQWTDNVVRMHQFMERHPEVLITTPLHNGTREFREFRATWPEGPVDGVSDTSLGWLMDKLEQHFDRTTR